MRIRLLLLVTVLALALLPATPGRRGSLSAAQPTQTFVGTISDDMCEMDGHASMRMGPTDAECTRACVAAHGASYVLADGKNVYTLSDQKTPEKLAGQRVRIVGTLDAKTKTIRVESMAAVK
jgi:hypothetical protein